METPSVATDRRTCLAPWRAISIRPNGNVLPDGQFEKSYGNINSGDLKGLLQSRVARDLKQGFIDGKFDAGCVSCQRKEKAIGHSRRIFFEHKIGHFQEDKNLVVDEEPAIQYLDLNLSSKCNLKCRMCSSLSSSSWVAEEKKLLKLSDRNFHVVDDPRVHQVDYDQALKAFDDPEIFKNLKYIALQGGEPLLEEQNLEILNRFVEWDLAKNVTIEINSNGTVINDSIKQMIGSFKTVDFYVSLEATGALYSYIRGGHSFTIKDLEENLRELRAIPNINLKFAVTVSIYNILYLSELFDWFDSIRGPEDEINVSNAVVRPEYLSFQILPKDLKQTALEKLENSDVLSKYLAEAPRAIGRPGDHLIKYKLKENHYKEEKRLILLEKFKNFNSAVDKMRGTNLLSVAPALSPIFRAYPKA